MFLKKLSFAISFFLVIGILQFFILCNQKRINHENAVNSLVKLGRYLFFDRRLSLNNTRSCGTCHNPQFAFTDGYKRSFGIYADLHQRNTQPVFNLAAYKYLTSADSSFHTALQQMNNPLFSIDPIEMGVKGNEELILGKVKTDSFYKELFAKSYPGDADPISWASIKNAISQFMYTIKSNNSPYDKFIKGDSTAFTAAQKNGMQLFFSKKLNCAACHGGNNFSEPSFLNSGGDTLFYYNIGLYNTDGKGSYPEYDQGLYQHTKQINDMGAFRVPTLRNLAFTAPYFHDGSARSLEEVIDVFVRGGRKISTGLYNGDGAVNPFKLPIISGFSITPVEKNNLLLFLASLSDSSLITNPNYINPFTEDETKKK
ncbi:MAG: MbnH family di-heme enzyme [Chitinophagaceae bacterium]